MAVVDNINWSEVLKGTTVSAVHGNGNNRIQRATEILQQIAQQFVQVLNERARLLANSAQFQAALRDSAAIRTLPGSGLGYLWTGDVYCQQGRYAAAIAIFDQGLEAVPESDPYHQQLEQHRMIAMTNNSKHIDFIAKLPLYIVMTNILPRAYTAFSSELHCETNRSPYWSYCEFLSVSRAWQKIILKHHKGLHFHFGLEKKTFKKEHDQLVRFAPHVQRLDGTLYNDVCLDDLLSRANFSNLKELQLNCHHVKAGSALIQSLEWIADSLTHLTISDCWTSLRDILKACPNLVSLEAKDIRSGLTSYSWLTYPKMTHLSLDYTPDTDFPGDETIDFISRFPSLLSLELRPMRGSILLPIIHKLCPDLQVLYYGGRNDHFDTVDIQPNRRGITSAHLCGDGVYEIHDLIQFFHQHQKSLEAICCKVFLMDNDNTPLQLLNGRLVQQRDHQRQIVSKDDDPTQSETSFERLVNIEFLNSDLSISYAFNSWFILNGPKLKSISFPASHIPPNIANVMIQSKSLSKFKINYVRESGNVYGITQFLDCHVAMGNQSTLEEMAIRLSTSIFKVKWLPLLSKLQCLKSLELVAIIFSTNCISTIAKISQGCPALEKLTIGYWDADFAEGVLKPLSASKSQMSQDPRTIYP